MIYFIATVVAIAAIVTIAIIDKVLDRRYYAAKRAYYAKDAEDNKMRSKISDLERLLDKIQDGKAKDADFMGYPKESRNEEGILKELKAAKEVGEIVRQEAGDLRKKMNDQLEEVPDWCSFTAKVVAVICAFMLALSLVLTSVNNSWYDKYVARVEYARTQSGDVECDIPSTYEGLQEYCAKWDTFMAELEAYKNYYTKAGTKLFGWRSKKLLDPEQTKRANECYTYVQVQFEEAKAMNVESSKRLEIANGAD